MALQLRYVASALAAGAAAAAILTAPTSDAANLPTCTVLGGSTSGGIDTECQSPGNVQIRNNPPTVSTVPGPFFGYGTIYHHGHRAKTR